MFEALADASRQTARFLSLGHVRVLVISEVFAREGIKDLLDVLERESDTRLNSLIFISKGQPAREIMSTMTVFSKIPANDLVEKLETTSKQFGYNFRMAVDDVIRGIEIRGGGPVINGVYTRGGWTPASGSNDSLKNIEPGSILRVSSLAAFKDDKLKGWLTGDAALGTVLLHNRIKEFPVLLKQQEGNYLSFNVYQSQVSLAAESSDPEHPVFTVKITQQAALKEAPGPLDLTSPKVLKELSDRLIKESVKHVQAAITTAKEMGSDYLGFGRALQRKDPRGWKKVRDHWENVFADCEIRFDADVVIRHTDMRSNSFQIH